MFGSKQSSKENRYETNKQRENQHLLSCGYVQEFHCQRPVYHGKCGHSAVAGLPILFARRYYFNCIKIFINIIIIIIITNSLTTRIVGAPQMILQPVSSIFPVLHCPLGLGELQA